MKYYACKAIEGKAYFHCHGSDKKNGPRQEEFLSPLRSYLNTSWLLITWTKISHHAHQIQFSTSTTQNTELKQLWKWHELCSSNSTFNLSFWNPSNLHDSTWTSLGGFLCFNVIIFQFTTSFRNITNCAHEWHWTLISHLLLIICSTPNNLNSQGRYESPRVNLTFESEYMQQLL